MSERCRRKDYKLLQNSSLSLSVSPSVQCSSNIQSRAELRTETQTEERERKERRELRERERERGELFSWNGHSELLLLLLLLLQDSLFGLPKPMLEREKWAGEEEEELSSSLGVEIGPAGSFSSFLQVADFIYIYFF